MSGGGQCQVFISRGNFSYVELNGLNAVHIDKNGYERRSGRRWWDFISCELTGVPTPTVLWNNRHSFWVKCSALHPEDVSQLQSVYTTTPSPYPPSKIPPLPP